MGPGHPEHKGTSAHPFKNKPLLQASFRPFAQKGQAMVEFVIILPVLLLLVLGILQFSLIYKAKITLNYATFEAARTGSLNNASLTSMQDAFARNMAPLYTNSYSEFSGGRCSNNFTLFGSNSTSIGPGNVICAKRTVENQIDNGYVNITIINPGADSFLDHGIDVDGDTVIPNDNLMYRDATPSSSGSNQSLQDANLLKIHSGYCYQLLVPFVNRILWLMQRYGPTNPPPANSPDISPGFFGPPPSGSFAESCITTPADAGRFSIVLNSQGIIRMQSAAIQCETTDSCSP